MPTNVYFYVNGTPRLLMACVIADEFYSHHRRFLILLDQHGYRYDAILPRVRDRFDDILTFTVNERSYSHTSQLYNAYFNSYPELRDFFQPDSDVVLFGIGTPPQKFIVRYNKALGNTVRVYAEGLATDRALRPPTGNIFRRATRRLFARAFGYQHDYDVFYVFRKDVYRQSKAYPKLADMPDLWNTRSFAHYAALLTPDLPWEELASYDTVFFGQPLSNSEGVLTREEEEGLLRAIVGDQRVLVLPHPKEILEADNKYRVLPNARIFRAAVPNDLLLARLRPSSTMTYSSTIGLHYAMSNPASTNLFFPVARSQYEMLMRYRGFVPNIEITDRYLSRMRPRVGG